MIHKVKKLRDQIFGATKQDGHVGIDEPEPPEGSAKSMMSPRSRVCSYRENANPKDCDEFAVANRALRKEAGVRKDSFNRHNSNETSPAVLPPVLNSNSFTHQGAPMNANNLSKILSPTNSSGRRKSTPAALDMALRTAEGKAAVEELLKGSDKKLVFGNYFAGSSSAGREAQAAYHAAERFKTRTEARQPVQPTTPTAGSLVMRTQHSLPKLGSIKQRNLPMLYEVDLEKPASSLRSPLGVHGSSQSFSTHPVVRRTSGGMAVVPEDQTLYEIRASASVSSLADSGRIAAKHESSTSLDSSFHRPPSASLRNNSKEEVREGSATSLADEVSSTSKSRIVAMSPNVPASMSRKVWTLGDYNILRKMYTGYASTVFQAMCKKSLEMVALKVYHLENLCELNHYQVFREIRVHIGLQHQHIIQLFAAFQEGTDVVLVQEFAGGGDLYRLLHKNGGRLAERQAVEMVLHPFLLSLHYLHTRGILHRDIKPENVLFTDQRVLKLADFGLAIDLNEERAVTRAGTLDYMAPEVLRCPPKNLPQENKGNVSLYYSNGVDAWAVGVFAFELVVGVPPFAGETQMDSVDRIMHSVPEFPEKVSELAKDFMCAALRKHPGDRPTVLEMLHHPWIKSYQRRTSMRLSMVNRRRSSVVYGSAAGGGVLSGGVGPTTSPKGDGHRAPLATDGTDANDLSPEEIERMIEKLQVAKQHALARSGPFH